MNGVNLLSTFIANNATEPSFTPSHIRAALSGVSSSTSLACWIVLLLPQLIEQWKLKSSEGLSIGFILIWFIGDLANLFGSLWADLLPGVVLLAVWFCIADGLLISSYLYYKNSGSKTHEISERTHTSAIGSTTENDPTQPLLRRNSSSRRKSSLARRRRDSLSSIVKDTSSSSKSIFTQYVLPVVFVIAAGVIGYLFSSSQEPDTPADNDIGTGPALLGYLSAVLYLGARLPQIYQNHKKRSVYGLSLLFFLFSMLGNVTYAGGILLYRSDSRYVIRYLPWLLGSLGTVFEDLIILLQFYVYNTVDSQVGDENAILE